MSWFKTGALILSALILALIVFWPVKEEVETIAPEALPVVAKPVQQTSLPQKQAAPQESAKPDLRVLSVAIEEKNRFVMTDETMPKQINLKKSKQAKETPPVFLRCLFDPEGPFDVFVDPAVWVEPEKYSLIVHTSNGPQKLAFDFLASLEPGRSYELFFNREPFSVGGIRAFDYAAELNAKVGKEMNNPAPKIPQTLSIPQKP
ncbi:MAG: hypothetical protein AB7E49_10175 [Campylobacterales bacterium]